MIFLSALISAVLSVVRTKLCTYYLAAVFTALCFVLVSVLIRKVGADGN